MSAATVAIAISDNQGYAPDQIATSITLQDVLEAVELAIQEFGSDAKVVLSNGQRYGAGFGAFVRGYGFTGALDVTDANETEED